MIALEVMGFDSLNQCMCAIHHILLVLMTKSVISNFLMNIVGL